MRREYEAHIKDNQFPNLTFYFYSGLNIMNIVLQAVGLFSGETVLSLLIVAVFS